MAGGWGAWMGGWVGGCDGRVCGWMGHGFTYLP